MGGVLHFTYPSWLVLCRCLITDDVIVYHSTIRSSSSRLVWETPVSIHRPYGRTMHLLAVRHLRWWRRTMLCCLMLLYSSRHDGILSLMRTKLAQPHPQNQIPYTLLVLSAQEKGKDLRVTKFSAHFTSSSLRHTPTGDERSFTLQTPHNHHLSGDDLKPFVKAAISKQPRFGSHQARGSPFIRNTRSTYSRSRIYLVNL